MQEPYILRKCNCGEPDPPALYGEGMAKQRICYKKEKTEMFWTDFDGFVVECTNCGAITRHYKTPDEAAKAWNSHQLEYSGEYPG